MMIEIADEEALVLFELLAREIGDRKTERLATAIDHPAEFWALNAVHCALERKLSQPFVPNYRELLAIARDQVIAQCDPDGTRGPIIGAS